MIILYFCIKTYIFSKKSISFSYHTLTYQMFFLIFKKIIALLNEFVSYLWLENAYTQLFYLLYPEEENYGKKIA